MVKDTKNVTTMRFDRSILNGVVMFGSERVKSKIKTLDMSKVVKSSKVKDNDIFSEM